MKSNLRVKDTDALASDAESILSAYFVESTDPSPSFQAADASSDTLTVESPTDTAVVVIDEAAQQARILRRKQKKLEKRAKRKEQNLALKQAGHVAAGIAASTFHSPGPIIVESTGPIAVEQTAPIDAETSVPIVIESSGDDTTGPVAVGSSEPIVCESSDPTALDSISVDSAAPVASVLSVPSESPAPSEPSLRFVDLGLPEDVCSALKVAGYETPTSIQAATIPQLLQGRDVLGQAQTGTGKTAAFALPLLSRIDVNNPTTQVLVLAPTRELAIQVAESFERYGQHLRGLQVVPIYGGSSYTTQINALRRGAHIVVGTPGRVMDHMREDRLRIDTLRCLVLDEADEMLRMGFVDDVRWVLEQSPPQVQIALFSATMPTAIREIADRHLKDPHVVSIDSKKRTAATIRQRYVLVEQRAKLEALHRILEAEETDGVIVFVKTRVGTVELTESLINLGYSAVAINGDVPQPQRERAIEQLKQGTFDILVATDVAARGLDVQRVTHVVNYDLPFDSEAYVHRIGRTGRAGRNGEAIVFLPPNRRGFLREIDRAAGHEVESMEVPSIKQINALRIARFKSQIVKACEANAVPSPAYDVFAKLVEECITENDLDPTKLATVLALLRHGDKPFLLEESRHRNSGRRDDRNDNDHRGRGDRRSDRDRGDARAFTDRKPRRDRNDRGTIEAGSDFNPSDTERFRVEVGRAHGVRPGNLVRAIANEIGLDSTYIGQIAIFDEFSTVDLPSGMPRELFKTLGRAWVVGRQLRISKLSDHPDFRHDPSSRSDRPRRRKPSPLN